MINDIKEAMQNRIEQIETEMQGIKAHFSKLEGHLAEAKYWMDEILKNELEEVNEKFNDASIEIREFKND